VSSIAGLTDRGTVAAYLIVNTTRLSDRNYTTSRDVTAASSTRRYEGLSTHVGDALASKKHACANERSQKTAGPSLSASGSLTGSGARRCAHSTQIGATADVRIGVAPKV
jgi:hypothetical protein